MYAEVDKEEVIPGIKYWKNPGNKFNVLMLHYTADPEKDPNRDGADWYEQEKEGAPKAVWQKEYEIDFATKAGKLVYGNEYTDFDESVHFIESRDLGNVEYFMALDFGQRNPTAALIGALDDDGRVYIIDEYYKPVIPSVSSREMFEKFSYLLPEYHSGMSYSAKRDLANSVFQIKVIDPTTTSKNRTKIIEGEEIPYSVIEDFYDNGWEFERANNDWDAGVTRVREYLTIGRDGKSHLYFFKDKCPKLCWEFTHYRYQENTEALERKNNEPERPVKKNDHGVDALRYLICTRPNTPTPKEKPKTRIQKDFENHLKPKVVLNDFDID